RAIEASALQILHRMSGILHPVVFDHLESADGQRSYTVSTWSNLTACYKTRLVYDLQEQLHALRRDSEGPHVICNASGGPVNDYRVPWIEQENPRTFTDCREFAAEAWIGLSKRAQITPPAFNRSQRRGDLFLSSGSLAEKLIVTGGLDTWRAGPKAIPECRSGCHAPGLGMTHQSTCDNTVDKMSAT
ncbi:hypothetical protein F5146DRAFT_1017626, partial [Armillaria mellea]